MTPRGSFVRFRTDAGERAPDAAPAHVGRRGTPLAATGPRPDRPDRSSMRPHPHPTAPRSGAFLVLTVLAAACSPEGSAVQGGEAAPAASEQVKREVRDLITAVTPFVPTVSVAEQNAWYGRRRATLERLRTAGPEVGLEALRVYHERPDTLTEIRVGLLDVAAHTAPEETRPILVELVETFGEDLHVRTKAAEFLGRTSPEKAIEVIEPILRGEVPRQTYPPQERLLAAWNTACVAAEHDRIPLLCEIATDLKSAQDVRHLSVRLLGEEPSVQGRQALERLLVESSGNSYIRRLAAQSLLATVPHEELCPLLVRVLENEADHAMLPFLDDMIQSNCR